LGPKNREVRAAASAEKKGVLDGDELAEIKRLKSELQEAQDATMNMEDELGGYFPESADDFFPSFTHATISINIGNDN
jgi:hypothetical protein